jgi:putative FmdB family regulatory protein
VPLYEFRCEHCGPFHEWRPVSDCRNPARCPQCRADASRVLTPPSLVRTPGVVRHMRALEEKSAAEPDVVARPRPDEGPLGRPKPIVSPHPWAVGRGH